jgi:tetratricopeptide (TPR) repeat protein
MDGKLNLKTYFGEDLRDYLENPDDMKKFIEIDSQKITELSDEEKFKKVSQLAVHFRQLRNYEKAHELFKLASDYFEQANPKMEMINNLRWADVFRFENKFQEANDLLKKVEAIISTHSIFEYEDFYLQHLGKLYFDKTEFKSACECFEKALILRTKKANPELISSTEFALKITKQKILLKNGAQ